MPSDEALRAFEAMNRDVQTFTEKWNALKERIDANPNSQKPSWLYHDMERYIRGRLLEIRAMFVEANTNSDRLAMYIACARYFELKLLGERIGMEIEHPDTFMRSEHEK